MGGTERQRRSPTRISVFLTSWPDKENHLQEHLQRVGAGDWHSRADPGRGLTQVVAWAGMSMWRPPRVSLTPLDHIARVGGACVGQVLWVPTGREHSIPGTGGLRAPPSS